MKSKKILIPALLVATLLVGASNTLAFGGSSFNKEAFKSFSTEQQTAIEKAAEIREAAEEEAKKVLEDAGVDMQKLHEAMRVYHEDSRKKIEAVLESGDFEAYKSLVAGSPMENNITQENFDKMVEAHKSGFKGLMMGRGHRGFGPN